MNFKKTLRINIICFYGLVLNGCYPFRKKVRLPESNLHTKNRAIDTNSDTDTDSGIEDYEDEISGDNLSNKPDSLLFTVLDKGKLYPESVNKITISDVNLENKKHKTKKSIEVSNYIHSLSNNKLIQSAQSMDKKKTIKSDLPKQKIQAYNNKINQDIESYSNLALKNINKTSNNREKSSSESFNPIDKNTKKKNEDKKYRDEFSNGIDQNALRLNQEIEKKGEEKLENELEEFLQKVKSLEEQVEKKLSKSNITNSPRKQNKKKTKNSNHNNSKVANYLQSVKRCCDKLLTTTVDENSLKNNKQVFKKLLKDCTDCIVSETGCK